MMYFLSTAFVLSVLILATQQQDPNCPYPDGYFEDSNDLGFFYHCGLGVGVRTACPNNTLFFSQLGNCIPLETHPAVHGFYCEQSDGFFQLPNNDCTRFLSCIGWIPYIMQCPETTFWNGRDGSCGAYVNSTCFNGY